MPQIDYAALARGYVDYARPQIETQYGNARDALRAGLASRGLGGSNVARSYTENLRSAYDTHLERLPSAADTYAHGDTSGGYSPLGDLFTSIIRPVATFNSRNQYRAPNGQAAIPGAEHVGSGGSTGTENVRLANGSAARVVN